MCETSLRVFYRLCRRRGWILGRSRASRLYFALLGRRWRGGGGSLCDGKSGKVENIS